MKTFDQACARCAGHCAHEEDVRMMAQCLVLDIDSAAVSRLAAAVARRAGRAGGDDRQADGVEPPSPISAAISSRSCAEGTSQRSPCAPVA